MTLLDMIDLLENQIASLRARVAAMDGPGTSVAAPAAKRSPASAKKARRKPAAINKQRAGRKESKTGSDQLLLAPESHTSAEEEKPSLGKRQALGKSLLQLRKAAASRAHHVSTGAD